MGANKLISSLLCTKNAVVDILSFLQNNHNNDVKWMESEVDFVVEKIRYMQRIIEEKKGTPNVLFIYFFSYFLFFIFT